MEEAMKQIGFAEGGAQHATSQNDGPPQAQVSPPLRYAWV